MKEKSFTLKVEDESSKSRESFYLFFLIFFSVDYN